MAATLYLNLEDDIAKIVTKLKREKASEVVLVMPKGSFIFSDRINLKLLKKKIDLLGKSVSILTMDEHGQAYAAEAGFTLRQLPRQRAGGAFADIRPARRIPKAAKISAESLATPVAAMAATAKPRRAVSAASAAAAGPTAVKKVRKVLRPKPRVNVVPKSPSLSSRGPDNVFSSPSQAPVTKVRRSRRATAWIVAIVGLALIVFSILVLFILPTADITVYGKSQTIARDVDVNFDTKVQQADATALTMPATPFDETPQATVSMQTTGQKEIGSKSEGQVAIYNLTGQAISLKAATTILSIGSKNYLFTEDQNNIKPASGASDDKNATIAHVVAAGGGESYNAPASTRMEISNQVFGAQPQRLFAKTSTQIIGGNSRFVSVVSDDDLKSAQSQLKDKLLQTVKDKLKQQNLILLDDASSLTVNDFVPDKTSGTESPTVTVSGSLRITGLAFNEEDLKNIIRQRISNSLATGRQLQGADQDKITYKVKNYDLNAGTMSLSLHYESQAKISLEANSLSTKILGKTRQQVSEILLSNDAIDRVEITLHPSWQQNTPLFKGKIHIKIQE